MNILIAPDSFKGSLPADVFCDVAERAILSRVPSANIVRLPLADGGEGTVDTLLSLPGAEKITLNVSGPMGMPVKASYGYIAADKTAIIEMASASGLPLVSAQNRNAMQASTIGTGELFLDALRRGAQRFLLGLGGSATTDAGLGMLTALGFQFLDAQGQQVTPNGEGLSALASIVPPATDFDALDIQVACDIRNPLFGPEGAAYVFAPQKGASEKEVVQLDQGLKNFASVVKADLNLDVADLPGAGAAGGMGAGMQLIGGHLRSGFDMVADFLSLDALLADNAFDLVITGEGQFNHQSLYGKVPVELAKRAKREGAFVVAIVGAIDETNDVIQQQGIDAIFALANKPLSVETCMTTAEQLLFNQTQNIISVFANGKVSN